MKKLLVPCLALAALAACKGAEGIGGVDDPIGSLRFSHGALANLPAGTYHAEGDANLSATGQFTPGDWAFGQLSASPNDLLMVIASQPSVNGGGRHDLAMIELPRNVRAGENLDVVVDCGFGGPNARCTDVLVSFGLTPRGDNPEYGCAMTTGQVRVTSRGDGRIKGTFSGSLSCVNSVPDGGALQITNGSFDVPVVDFSR
jgi:hypothetical protein